MKEIRTPFGGILELYPCEAETARETVLICPGGGYSFLAPREAEPIAGAFGKAGYHAAVLKYCLEKEVLGTDPVRELAWSVRWLRNAAEWRGRAERLYTAGFSAGGHLAASLGVL